MSAMTYVYELRDCTDDEVYLSRGLYATAEAALKDATTGEHPPTEHAEEGCEMQVIRRPIGPGAERTVHTVNWREGNCDEDYVWRVIRIDGVDQ